MLPHTNSFFPIPTPFRVEWNPSVHRDVARKCLRTFARTYHECRLIRETTERISLCRPVSHYVMDFLPFHTLDCPTSCILGGTSHLSFRPFLLISPPPTHWRGISRRYTNTSFTNSLSQPIDQWKTRPFLQTLLFALLRLLIFLMSEM